METIITKQKDVLNGNEAFLMGVDREGNQIWLEVLNSTEFACSLFEKDNLDLNNRLAKKVFNLSDGNILNCLLYTYTSTQKFVKRHPEHQNYLMSVQFQILIKSIIDILKPTF